MPTGVRGSEKGDLSWGVVNCCRSSCSLAMGVFSRNQSSIGEICGENYCRAVTVATGFFSSLLCG